MIILETCQKQPFDIIAMTRRGTLRLCCVHIAQLMTNPAIYTLLLTLQLCYKPPGILQRVTKSQKVHISSHDELQNCNVAGKLLQNCWRYHHFTHVYQKPESYEVQFLRHRVRQICFVTLGQFLPFTHPQLSPAPHPILTTQKTKFLKK